MNKILFTCGDVNGIGPEIIIKSLNSVFKNSKNKYYVICPQDTFHKTSKLVKPEFDFSYVEKYQDIKPGTVCVISLQNVSQNYGKPTKGSGKTAFDAIKLAIKLAISRSIDAIITAPISKTAIHLAGVNFPGHTEMLAEYTHIKNYSMMFLSRQMKASLVSIHEPIRNVIRFIKEKQLHSIFDVVINSLNNDFNLYNPKIAVLGLNPHAGENGAIGREEEKIILPAIKNYSKNKYLSGPFSPDAFFANRSYKKFDMVVGMYHDQLLIPFKLLNFGGGVNYTAGLPIIRTSPDHGVAYDIAGKNLANPSSMIQAHKYALTIIKNRTRNARNL
jgi:4-hydroxythreonine-4-phosphate dehydrogenase